MPTEKLKVADGAVNPLTAEKLTYGQIAETGLLHRSATAKVEPKPPSEHKIVGKPIPRLDIPAKVVGGPVFVQDMHLPGMVFGRIVRPPGPRARLEEVDTSSVQRMPGVLSGCADGSFLGVVAVREEQAIERVRGTAPEREMAAGGRSAGARTRFMPGCGLNRARMR